MAGFAGATNTFPFWKVVPEMAPGVRFILPAVAELPFWTKMRIWGGQEVFLDICGG